jgi:hypothetical protein
MRSIEIEKENHSMRKDAKIQTGTISETDSEDDFEPLKNVRQSIKVLARTIYCSKCLSTDPSSKETASFYCPCGTFVCTYHIITHKCLVTSSMEYDRELLSSLT